MGSEAVASYVLKQYLYSLAIQLEVLDLCSRYEKMTNAIKNFATGKNNIEPNFSPSDFDYHKCLAAKTLKELL